MSGFVISGIEPLSSGTIELVLIFCGYLKFGVIFG
jgi:hypothetical protein